jgi:DNA-binding PadR family transcriptional regulator
MKAARVTSGTLYPMLDHFQDLGWIEGYAEDIDERAAGRPRRRLYRLTGIGRREAQHAVKDFYRDIGPAPKWVPGLEGS